MVGLKLCVASSRRVPIPLNVMSRLGHSAVVAKSDSIFFETDVVEVLTAWSWEGRSKACDGSEIAQRSKIKSRIGFARGEGLLQIILA